MSTRSRIGIELPNGTVRSIYCHFDGYISNNGKILLENYSDPAKVEGLINLGNLSILGTDIGEKHDFVNHGDRTDCLAYGRDRGENQCDPVVSENAAAFAALARSSWGEYVYLFRNGTWFVRNLHTNKRFVKLTTKLVDRESLIGP